VTTLAGLFADKILRCLDRIVALLDGLDDDAASWRPAAGANSLAGIANHMLANAEENVLGVIAGGRARELRDRSGEFAPESAAAVRERWEELRPQLAAALAKRTDDRLHDPCEHPRRGAITVAEMLVVLLRHAGEHEGEAMLTRSLLAGWDASRGAPGGI
jgi:uncharacterized damage-inducible protein DinB